MAILGNLGVEIMKKSFLALAISLVIFAGSQSAKSAILNFDDLKTNTYNTGFFNTTYGIVPNGYGNLDWDNIHVTNGYQFGTPGTYVPIQPWSPYYNAGIANGIVSATNVAYNGAGNTAVISGINGAKFDFISGYFTYATWLGGSYTPMVITAYDNNNIPIHSLLFYINDSTPTFESFNWYNVSKIVIPGNANYTDVETNMYQDENVYAMDNLDIRATTPATEPSSMVLGFMGIAYMLGLRRKRK